MLVSSLKFLQESSVVLREHSQVAHAILEIGDSLDTHTKGVSAIYLAVDAALLEDIGIDHTATEDLNPSGVLAESATLAAADMARDVHLGTRFGEGEIARTKANLGVGTKHLAGKRQKNLLQVGE